MISLFIFCATLFATPNKKPLENQGVNFNVADRTGLVFL